ncbi:hypothetical protein GQ600_9487 [Phytophthora cactorum]|nr:hypothetical protein GQ600_9487 [Phytophthora cactorum]
MSSRFIYSDIVIGSGGRTLTNYEYFLLVKEPIHTSTSQKESATSACWTSRRTAGIDSSRPLLLPGPVRLHECSPHQVARAAARDQAPRAASQASDE